MAMVKHAARQKHNQRLFPHPFHHRFYILRLLNKYLAMVARNYMADLDHFTLVDFGCGSMPYRSLFHAHRANYIGLDLPGNELADMIIESERDTGLPGDSADFVLSTQVLEHVNNPTLYIQECYRILKPGGLLILSTHGYWRYHPNPQDLWRWTGDGLRRVATDAGFAIRDFYGLVGLTGVALQLLQDAWIHRVPSKQARSLVTFGIQHIIWLSDVVYHFPSTDNDAMVYLIVAQK